MSGPHHQEAVNNLGLFSYPVDYNNADLCKIQKEVSIIHGRFTTIDYNVSKKD